MPSNYYYEYVFHIPLCMIISRAHLRFGLWAYTEPDISGHRKDPLSRSTFDIDGCWPTNRWIHPDALSSGPDIPSTVSKALCGEEDLLSSAS